MPNYNKRGKHTVATRTMLKNYRKALNDYRNDEFNIMKPYIIMTTLFMISIISFIIIEDLL